MKRLISIIILAQLTFLNADNYSLSFDGVDDYVEIADSDELDGMEQLTVQFWANLSEYSLGVKFIRAIYSFLKICL